MLSTALYCSTQVVMEAGLMKRLCGSPNIIQVGYFHAQLSLELTLKVYYLLVPWCVRLVRSCRRSWVVDRAREGPVRNMYTAMLGFRLIFDCGSWFMIHPRSGAVHRIRRSCMGSRYRFGGYDPIADGALAVRLINTPGASSASIAPRLNSPNIIHSNDPYSLITLIK